MITLTGQREIAQCNVYRDDVDPLQWYIMPQSPRIALDETGKPVFSLVWYRRDVSKLSDEERKSRLGGGILALSVELSTTDAEMKELRDTLANDPEVQARTGMDKDKLAKALSINTLPITDGTVTIAILAEGGDTSKIGEFVASLVGIGRVSMTGRERASFMAKLTQDGAVLLWDMVEKNLPAIRVGYDLKFNHRLNAVSMSVWCDARKSFNAIQEQWNHVSEDASWSDRHTSNSDTYTYGDDQSDNARNRIFSAVHASEYSGVNITQEAGPDAVKPDEINQLVQSGNEMIKDFLAGTFLEYKPGADYTPPDQEPDLKTELASVNGKKYGHDAISRYSLKTWDESMNASLGYNFTSKTVLEGHIAPNDNLGNVLRGHAVNELRTQVDIDASYYKYLDVQVVCTADFDDDPIDLVKAHLTYQGHGAQGDINKVGDFMFKKDTPPQRFSTYLASPDQITYQYDCEIFYKGTSDKYSFSGNTNETILVLDVDKLGVLRVDVQMGVIDWDRIKQVLLKMSYGSGPNLRETEFTLDAQHQGHRWVEVVAPPVSEAYTYQAIYVDKNDQQIATDPQTARSKTLVLNQPLLEALKVMIVSAGSFGSGGLISQVVVATRYQDPANSYDVNDVFPLTKEGDSKVWTVPLMDKTLRKYDYKVTVFYSDGVTREDQWHSTDNAVLAVGDPFGFRVQILPYLLRGNTWAFGTVSLRFDDSEGDIHAEKTFEIKDFTTPLAWHFRLGAPDRHTYHYQLTLYRAVDGKQFTLAPADESKEVLVLIPPSNP
jgi:hypothetical protein